MDRAKVGEFHVLIADAIRHYGRITAGVSDYVRRPQPASREQAIRDQLETREKGWLELVRRAVFERQGHPYEQLFRMAGCEYGDLEKTVLSDGLEEALAQLHRAGVYVTHDEFKGKKPIERSGREIDRGDSPFENPFASGWLETRSSGSRSGGTTSAVNTAQMLHREAYYHLSFLEWGFYQRVNFAVRPILPSGAGINSNLGYARNRCDVARWFAIGGHEYNSLHYRLLTSYLVGLARMHGIRMPYPSFLPPNDFTPVARAMAKHQSEGRSCSVQGVASTGVRVARAALDKGLDISKTLFVSSGEALTEPKRRVIESTGAEIRITYWISEIGPIGMSCNHMTGSCVHLFSDSVAVVSHRRKAPFSDVDVNSLLFTTLLPESAHLLINVEMDDSGIIEKTSCDCQFSRVGLRHQIREIGSFGKLTGQGMTLVGSDIVQVLEEFLPGRFGGGPGDYQLVEQDGESQTQLTLRVSSRATLASTEAVKEYFMKRLEACYGGRLASRVWSHTNGFNVVQAEPISNRAGKVAVLHLLAGAQEPVPGTREQAKEADT